MIKRITAALILDSSLIINAYKFTRHLPVGNLKFTVERLQELRVDEIIILNSSHTDDPHADFRKMYDDLDSLHISTPIAYGGGIISRIQAADIVKSGADRIVVSARVLFSGEELAGIGDVLGEQAIIIHLPIILQGSEFKVLNFEDASFDSIIDKIPQNWGGELLLSIVDRDGAETPNWDLVESALPKLGNSMRVILCSGFSKPEDILRGLEVEMVQAVAIGNFLHRTEVSISFIKKSLATRVQVR